MRLWFVFSVLMVGCSAEIADVNSVTPYQDPQTSMSPTEHSGGPQCPPPVTVTVIRNGQETTETYTPPCFAAPMSTSHASDPPGWGSDGSDNGSDMYPTGPAPTVNRPQPGDPVPRLLK